MNAEAGALERYLKVLKAELRARGVNDAGDLADEITSHVREAAGLSGGENAVSRALEAFGEPAALAASVAAERYAGAMADGPRPAAWWRRAAALALDAMWVLGVPGVMISAAALWWGAIEAHLQADPAVPMPVLLTDAALAFALIEMAIAGVWLAVTAHSTWRARRARRATIGMRATGLAYAPSTEGRPMVCTAQDAIAAGAPPAKGRGRAVFGLTAVLLLVALALAWQPLNQMVWQYVPTESNTGFDDAYATVDYAYQALLDQSPEARTNAQSIFSDSDTTFDEFVRGYEQDRVIGSSDGGSTYRSADEPGIPVTEPEPAYVEIVRVETGTEPDGSRTSRQVFFTFRLLDKVPDEGGAAQPTWRLVSIVRDPMGPAGGSGPTAAEARTKMESLLGENTLGESDRSIPSEAFMTASFAASSAAAPFLPGAAEQLSYVPRSVIDSVGFDGAAVVVRTTEGWMPAGGDGMNGEKRRYEYRVVKVGDEILVDGRERIE